MLNKIKSQKGITGIDLSISIIIIMLFISIIAALSINVSTSLTSKGRLDVATNCMTEIMEKVDKIDYSYVEESNKDENDEYVFLTIKNIDNENENIAYVNNANPSKLTNEIAGILEKNSDYSILSVYLKVEDYKPEVSPTPTPITSPAPTATPSPSLVKKVTVKIIYKLNNQDETIEVTRLKTIYNVDLEETTTSTTG